MNRIFYIVLSVFSIQASSLEIGKKPSPLELKGDEGGLVSGQNWSSSSISKKLTVLFYVDPDEKELNDPFTKALKEKKFSREKFQSIAVINMAATWAPNFAIESALEKKQKEFPETIYVKDKDKKLVKNWKLGDDTNAVAIFDKDGKVLFHKDGKLSDKEIADALNIISKNI